MSQYDEDIEQDKFAHNRETFARYGKAMYEAQVLEHGIVNLVATHNLKARREAGQRFSPYQIEALWDAEFVKTFGKLLKVVGEALDVPTDLRELLRRALKIRNWLAHDFFRDHAYEILTTEGRRTMIGEADEAGRLFARVDEALETFLKPIALKLGVTDELLQQEFENNLRRAGVQREDLESR